MSDRVAAALHVQQNPPQRSASTATHHSHEFGTTAKNSLINEPNSKMMQQH